MIERFMREQIDAIDKMGFVLDDDYTKEDEYYTFIKKELVKNYYIVLIELRREDSKWHLYGVVTNDYEIFDAYAFTLEELSAFFKLLCILEEKYKEVMEGVYIFGEGDD